MRVLLLLLAIALTYANTVDNPFILDDQATVVQNPQIRDPSSVRDVLVPASETPVAGRPLASLSFAVNYAVSGLDVRGYHLVNIALHAVCALLLLLVARRTLALTAVRPRFGSSAGNLAFAAALLWALHPLNSEVVNYISQRSESLMAAFFLLTLYAAIRAHEQRGVGWTFVAIAACLAGVASKESMAVAPLVIALYDRVFFFESWRAAVRTRRWLYVGLAATWVFAAVLIAAGPRAAVAGFSSGISPWTYLLNQAVVITHYLRLTLWPDSLVVFYGWPQALGIVDVAPYLLFVGALVFLSGFLLWRRPMIGFLGAWFFITLAPASSIVPIATEVGAERRMYLPLMALAVLAVAGADFLWKRFASRSVSSVPLVAAVVVAAVLAGATVARNREYASPLTLAQTVVDRRPTNVAHHILGEQLVTAGRRDEAVRHLREAVTQGDSRARYPLGRILAEQGSFPEAVQQLEALIATSQLSYRLVPRWLEPPITEVMTARLILGRVLYAQQRLDAAVEQADTILAAFPNHSGAYSLRADALFAQQQWAAAGDAYREYLRRAPADPQALINYGITQAAAGNLDGAIVAFTAAADLDPANARAKQLLALAREDRARLSAQP
jgi:tetratricopeptide (TPR) repeat protein